jgi:hypothetical protein
MLREECRLRVLKNRVLKKVQEPMKLATLLSQPLVRIGHTLRNQQILLIVYMVFTPQVGHLYVLNLCHCFTVCAVLYV